MKNDDTIITPSEFQEESANAGKTKKNTNLTKDKHRKRPDPKAGLGGSLNDAAAVVGLGKLVFDAIHSESGTKVIVFKPAVDVEEEIIELDGANAVVDLGNEGQVIVENEEQVVVEVEEDNPTLAYSMSVMEKGVEVSELPFAQTVDDSMSFKAAFAAARQELGSGGLFIWHGKPYGTFYGSELKAMSAEAREQYVDNVRYSLEQLERQQEQEEVVEEREELPLVEQLEPKKPQKIDSIDTHDSVADDIKVEVEEDSDVIAEEDDIVIEVVDDVTNTEEVDDDSPDVEDETDTADDSTDEYYDEEDDTHPDYDSSASFEIDEALPIDNQMPMDEFF